MNLAGKVVLLLEDEPIILLSLEDLMTEAGAEVIAATTLEQAREAAAAGGIDAAVLDVHVRGERSYGFAEMLRADGVPFVFATGYGAAAHEGDFAGWPTVEKPYRLADIQAALTLALASAQSR